MANHFSILAGKIPWTEKPSVLQSMGLDTTTDRRSVPAATDRTEAALCWSSSEEIAHVQGKRNPSKMVGVARGHQKAGTLKP